MLTSSLFFRNQHNSVRIRVCLVSNYLLRLVRKSQLVHLWEFPNLEYLSQFRKDSEVTPEKLREAELINTLSRPVVIMSRGELTKPLKVKAHRFTRKAIEKIEKAGGSVEVIED